MMSAQLPITKPAMATAVPVNAFSSEITTGMSAPPIGITIETPNASAAKMTTTSSQTLGEVIRYAPMPTATAASSQVHDPGAGERDRRGRDDALQLAGGDERSGERDRADDHVQQRRDRGRRRRLRAGLHVVVEADQRGSAAADRVEHADQLRHRGHLDGPGRVQSGRAAHQRTRDQHEPAGRADHVAVDDERQRRGDCRDHARGGDLVAAARRGRGVHQVQAEHEARRGQDIDELDDPVEGAHAAGPLPLTLGAGWTAWAAGAVWTAAAFVRGRQRGPTPEHLQHAAGDHVAADDVRRGERGRQECDHVPDRVVRGHGDEHRAGQHDAVDRVRRRHQRRVQGSWHLADDLEAHPEAEHEDGDVNEQSRVRHGRPLLPVRLGVAVGRAGALAAPDGRSRRQR